MTPANSPPITPPNAPHFSSPTLQGSSSMKSVKRVILHGHRSVLSERLRVLRTGRGLGGLPIRDWAGEKLVQALDYHEPVR
eukprot:1256035-Rhodomonas_salina.2